MAGVVAIYPVHQDGDAVRNHQLLEKAPSHQEQPVLHPSVIEPVWFPELMQEIFAALDGPCHQLGEKGQEQGIAQEIPLRRHLPPPDVHQIAYGLEGIERDAHRQQHVKGG